MPDILIRGMEMPKSCSVCPFCFGANNICPWTREYATYKGRHADCPLLELMEHGDLIDVSKVVLKYGGLAKISPYDFVGIAKYFAEQLEGQPVIVPAERREE